MPKNEEISENYLDLYSIGPNKLICYTFGLIFGKPVFKDYNLTFETDSYIKILHFEFEDYIDFFLILIAYLSKSSEEKAQIQTENKNTYLKEHVIVSHSLEHCSVKQNIAYVCYANVIETLNSNSVILELCVNLPQKLKFSLNECEIYSLLFGFQALFFKVFCYKSDIYYNIKLFIDQQTIEQLERILNNSKINDIICLLPLELNQTLKFTLYELIIRHKTDIISWKKLSDFHINALKNN